MSAPPPTAPLSAADAAAAAALPTIDITHNLNLTLGMLEVGVLISMVGFGIVRVFPVPELFVCLTIIHSLPHKFTTTMRHTPAIRHG
jgi:hypothetical protein